MQEKTIEDHNIHYGLVVRTINVGSSFSKMFSPFNLDLQEGVEPSIQGTPKARELMENSFILIERKRTQPNQQCRKEHDNHGKGEKYPKKNRAY